MVKRLPAMEGASNAKRRHLLFPQASTDKDEGAIRKDRAFRFILKRRDVASLVWTRRHDFAPVYIDFFISVLL